MSYLQHGHVEKSFYERSHKTYLNNSKSSFISPTNKSFLDPTNSSFLSSSNSSFIEPSFKSFLSSSNGSFLSTNSNASHIKATNTSFIQYSNKSYLTDDDIALDRDKNKSSFLELDNVRHVRDDNVNHLDEDKKNHLEESGGETSDEDNEDFSHAVDWGLVVPPYITPLFINNTTKYKCGLTGGTYDKFPQIPERFDVFDFDKMELIVNISRYYVPKNKSVVIQTGKEKYNTYMNINKFNSLHVTELQSECLENLRVWKHKKEQELLGQTHVSAADLSDRTDRMGVGDQSASGAAKRKQQREALKKKQQKEREQQNKLKQKIKFQEQQKKQQQIKIQNQQLAQQRQYQKQQNVQNVMQLKSDDDFFRQQQRDKSNQKIQDYVKVQSKNDAQRRQNNASDALNRSYNQKLSNDQLKKQQRDADRQKLHTYVKFDTADAARQRKRDAVNNLNDDYSSKRNQDLKRQQQRIQDREQKHNYVTYDLADQAKKRQQNKYDDMKSQLDEKQNLAQKNRLNKKVAHDDFLFNVQQSQDQNRAVLSQERLAKFSQQQQDQITKSRTLANQRDNLEREQQRKELERLKKQQQKAFATEINNLLDSKSNGIDFDEFANEYYIKYTKNWNPQAIFGLSDLDSILQSNGLSSTVKVLSGGMTKRAILWKHFYKIKIVSTNTNDILTVLAISNSIDDAIRQLRQMQMEKVKKAQADIASKRQQYVNKTTPSYAPSYGFSANINYSKANNWGLPKGWRVKKTGGGRLFFVDDRTKKTTWDDPRPLPTGWRSGKTGAGKKFYIDDRTKKTQWDDPRPPIYI